MSAFLSDIDQAIFYQINGLQLWAWLESVLIYWRTKTTWMPLYLLVMLWILIRYKWRALWFIIALGLTVGLADQLSAHFLKPLIHRARPCQVPLASLIQRVSCGAGMSFPSSHATDHFALAGFVFNRLKPHYRWITLLILVWAAIVAFAQVFVGVHYPSDVLFGALLGWTIGYVMYEVYLRLLNQRAI